MNQPPKDYTAKGRTALFALIVLLIGVSFIPPQTVGGVKLRRANILSEILSFDDQTDLPATEAELPDEEEFLIDLEEVSQKIEQEVVAAPPHTIQKTFRWDADSTFRAERRAVLLDTTAIRHAITPIEDFSAEGSMEAFYDTLLHARRPVRIAFMGDSFIEGDILTQDLREELQAHYGGGGAGFAPFSSPLTGFRRSIKTQAKGWIAHNVMQWKKTPELLRDNFYVSGWCCAPSAGASTRWEMSSTKPHLGDCTAARVYFIAKQDAVVRLVLNDTARHEVAIEGDDAVREIIISAPRIASLAVEVAEGAAGFIGYGAVFEDEGVVVDNYSVRSNNGQAMFRTNPSVNAQINTMMPYDLVILQYGLNMMQQDVHLYTNYAAQIEKMVAYTKQCFPSAAVLVLGVSDRSVKGANGYEPMNSIPAMVRFQRGAAQKSGAAFWSTVDAMRSMGGMAEFVAKGWAGKDFTHINFGGGRQVAHRLYDAIHRGVQTVAERERVRREQERARRLRIDSLSALMPEVALHVPEAGVELPAKN